MPEKKKKIVAERWLWRPFCVIPESREATKVFMVEKGYWAVKKLLHETQPLAMKLGPSLCI